MDKYRKTLYNKLLYKLARNNRNYIYSLVDFFLNLITNASLQKVFHLSSQNVSINLKEKCMYNLSAGSYFCRTAFPPIG